MADPYTKIKPATAGEKLFQRLIRLADKDFDATRIRHLAGTRMSGRGEEFGDYLEGALLSFCFLRVMKAADGIYERDKVDISMANKRLFNLLSSWFDWIQKDVVGSLFRDALRAHQSSDKRIPRAVAKEVWHSRRVHMCGFCGERICSDTDGEFRDSQGIPGTLEHIWPSSLGGDSIADNLLPACGPCNNEKADLFAWEQRLVHDFVYPVNFESREFYEKFPRVEKILLQRRAVMQLAARDKLTLKDAMRRVGPYGRLEAIDVGDTWDFFNVQNHSESLGERLW